MTQFSVGSPDGPDVTAVTASEMRAVDRVAVEDVGLQLLQMMENAGRALAWHVRARREKDSHVLVVAGKGGNGGGGMACARHLANRDVPVSVLLDRSAEELGEAASSQYGILSEMGVSISPNPADCFASDPGAVVVDALIGYGLAGEVRQPAADYIQRMNRHDGTVVSLDVPSGTNATTGDVHGPAVTPDRTVTLALPKTGLTAIPGSIYLADIGIPDTVYDRLDIEYETVFGDRDWVELVRHSSA